MSRQLTVGSLFSGLGAFDLAFERAGWKTVWRCEIDPDARRVLEHHWPATVIYNDVSKIDGTTVSVPDIIIGGSPCTDLSVAGKRGGLAGERSGLFTEMVRIADESAARWFFWENVPGAFSTPEGSAGEDFACVLELVTGFRPAVPRGGWLNSGICVGPKRAAAWTVLDTQYRGLAQRRERVFLVARAGDTRGLDLTQPGQEASRLRGLPCQVLFEPESVQRHSPPGGKKRKGAARRAKAGPGGKGGDARRAEEALAQEQERQGSGGRVPEGHGEGIEERAQAFQCHGNNVGPIGTLRAGNGGLTGGVPFLAEGGDRADGAVTAKWAKGTSGPAGDECENLIPVETVGPLLAGGSSGRGHRVGADEAGAGHVVPQPTTFNVVGCGQQGRNHAYQTDVSGCLQHKGLKPTGNEAGTVVVCPETAAGREAGSSASPGVNRPGRRQEDDHNIVCATGEITHSLTARHDGGEDGTRRGTPLGPVAFHVTQDPISGHVAPAQGRGNAQGCGTVGVAYTLHGKPASEVASETDLAGTQRARQPGTLENSTTEVIVGKQPAANQGGTVVGEPGEALAFQERGRDGGPALETQSDLAYALTSPAGGGRAQERNIQAGMTVRRLTPTECLRLQGLPDDWLDLDRPLSDSAKYRLIGNAGGVPVVEWIAARIRAVEEGRDPNEEAHP